MQHRPYVPRDIGELLDLVGSMMLAAPTFRDKTGFLPRENIDTAFFSLNEGLQVVREQLGEERYAALKAMSDEMRALFESDPLDKTGSTQAGRVLVQKMEDILMSVAKKWTPE